MVNAATPSNGDNRILSLMRALPGYDLNDIVARNDVTGIVRRGKGNSRAEVSHMIAELIHFRGRAK